MHLHTSRCLLTAVSTYETCSVHWCCGMHIHAHTPTHTHTHIRTHTQTQSHTHAHTGTHTRIHTHTHTHMRAHTHTHTHTCERTHTNALTKDRITHIFCFFRSTFLGRLTIFSSIFSYTCTMFPLLRPHQSHLLHLCLIVLLKLSLPQCQATYGTLCGSGTVTTTTLTSGR